MVNAYEQHEQWMTTYPQENNLTPVYVSFFDAQQTQPDLIIFNMSQ